MEDKLLSGDTSKVCRGSEAFKEMKSFATPTQSISLISTPCVPGTETISLLKMSSAYS